MIESREGWKEGSPVGTSRIGHDEVMAEVLQLFGSMAEDWEYSGEITPDTLLFGDVDLQSLDVVVLAISVQQHYEATLPFADLFANMGKQGVRDLSIGELAEFVYRHLNDSSAEAR